MPERLPSLELLAPSSSLVRPRSAGDRDTESVLETDRAARVVASGLGKSYGSHRVLHDLDLALAPRSLVAVAGGNGVGKSTLLACLAGTVRHAGSVLLDGRPVGRATRGRVAYLPQRLRMPASATGREVGRLFAALGDGRADRVPLPDGFLPPLDKPIGQLSGEPDLVLLDEPFANLDDEAREQAHALLRAHRDAGASVLVASPTAIDLLALVDRVVLIADGSVGFDGAPARYAGRLEMAVWVRARALPAERVAGLGHVLRSRQEGEWLALECHEDRVIGLLRDLGALGIPADDVRLGGPLAEARLSTSPEAPRGEART